MGPEKDGGDFLSQTEHRETVVFSCSSGIRKNYMSAIE